MVKIILRYLLLCALAILFTNFHKNILNLESLQVEFLSKIYSSNQISKFIRQSQSLQNYTFLFIALNIFLKTISVSLIIFLYCVFQKIVLDFKKIFEIVVTAEYIFLLPIIYEIIYFCYFKKDYSYFYIQNFSSLSLLNFFDKYTFEPWYIYPLQTFNLFELAYVVFLGYQMSKFLKTTPAQGFLMVVSSYVPALIFWVCCIMFLTLNNS